MDFEEEYGRKDNRVERYASVCVVIWFPLTDDTAALLCLCWYCEKNGGGTKH